MKKIIVIGSLNMDIVSRVDRHPRPGETLKSKNFLYIPGGKGANQAVAMRRLGGNVCMLGKIGNDAFGEGLLQFFREEGMDTSNIVTSENVPTGAAFVAVDNSSENIIYVSSGANDDLSPSDTEHTHIETEDIVSATLETPLETTKQLFIRARENEATTILNAAPATEDTKTIFHLVDYLIVNETELSVFAHTKVPETVDDAILSMRKIKSDGMNVIATLGKQGAVALIGEETIVVKGYAVEAVDTTAAGDCFVGAFAMALQEGKKMKEAIDFANTAAALSIQRLGASSSLPTREEVESFVVKMD